MPEILITPFEGQRVFTLQEVPETPFSVGFFVNTVSYTNGLDFKVSENIVEWLAREFKLDSDDVVRVTY